MKKTISLLCALFMAFSSVSVPIKAEEEIETEKPMEEVQEIEEQEQKETEEEAQAASDEAEIPEETEKQEEVTPVEEEKQEEKEEEPAEEITEEEVGEDAELLNGTYGDLTYEISDGKVTITDCDQSATAVDIPAEIEGYPVTSIDDSAFSGCSKLATITIPNSVTSIGQEAFRNCNALTNIVIPESVIELGGFAFEGCINLKTAGPVGGGYDLEFGWTDKVPSNAFYGAELTSVMIPDGIISIGELAFSNCWSLSSVTVPESVTSVGDNAFIGCKSIKTAGPIGGGYNYEFGWKDSIPSYALHGSGLTSVIIPDGVTSIGSNAFSGCHDLSSVTIPESVTSIEYFAFSHCENLKTAGPIGGGYNYEFGWKDSIPSRAFNYCQSLSDVTFPDGLTNIGEYAFTHCTGLIDIKIPESVKSIDTGAFHTCTGLSTIIIPNGVQRIGSFAFTGCENLKTAGPVGSEANIQISGSGELSLPLCRINNLVSVDIPDTITSIKRSVFANWPDIKSLTIPDSVTSIDDQAFQSCTGLTSITLPNSITSIGSGTFQGCSSLVTFTIPDSVTSIGGYAFRNCSSLNNITIPNSVTSIGEEAFEYCKGLSSITIPNSITSMGNNVFVGCTNLTSVTFEDGLTTIGKGTFQGCTKLSSITIPDSVTSVGGFVFSNCTGLENVIISGNISYDSTAFRGCNSLKTAGPVGSEANIQISGSGVLNICFSMFPGLVSVNIPNTFTELRSSVFKGCESLTEVIIPDGVTSIGSSAFGNCTSLTHLSIPDSVTEIGERSFSGCSNLTSVNIPEGVTSISDVLFDRCTSLKSITIPNGVKSIGIDSFSWCSALTSITIPNSVESLDLEAFYCCLGLTSIVIGNGVKKIDDSAFFFDDKVKYVFYVGTNTQWKKIQIGKNNECLSKVIFCPNYYQVKPFVERLYKLCFNRDADVGGLNNWMYYLLTGKKTAAQIVQSFFTSKEMQNLKLSDEEIVERCYQVMMGRASDAGGKKGWVEKLDAGMSVTYVLRGFVGSTEFDKICKQYGITRGSINVTEPRDKNFGITSFVSRCYSEVLGRKADIGGLNDWCNRILTASNRKQAAINAASNGFFHSEEYMNKHTSNDQYVRTLYRTFLGREADQGGYNDWMNRLRNGTSRDSVMKGFANSAEFAKIMAKYGIK